MPNDWVPVKRYLEAGEYCLARREDIHPDEKGVFDGELDTLCKLAMIGGRVVNKEELDGREMLLCRFCFESDEFKTAPDSRYNTRIAPKPYGPVILLTNLGDSIARHLI